MPTYQTKIYKAVLSDFELGWQATPELVIFESKHYDTPSDAILEYDFHEPSAQNWFVSMVERINGEITDEEIFDSSVVDMDYKVLDIL